MFPGMNNRQAQQMMRKMGIQQQEIDADQVIIRCKGENIIIDDPQVSKVNMMGQETFQIAGETRTETVSAAIEISDEDVEAVVAQTECSKEEARKALEEHDGDIAETIMALKG